MRAKLVIVGWLYLISLAACANEMPVPFPAELAGGSVALNEWVKNHHLELPSSVEMVARYDEGDIVVVYHSSGSGMPLLDVYVYACSVSNCTLIAARRHIQIDHSVEKPIEARISSEGSEFVLSTQDGTVQLLFSLDELARK
jgi:hypothetical protein